MENVLFLQSEIKDPYKIYDRMLLNHPLYYDESNTIWAVYSFDDCDRILKSSAAFVPGNINAFTNESEEVKAIIQNLARLSNPPYHSIARKASLGLMKMWKPVEAAY